MKDFKNTRAKTKQEVSLLNDTFISIRIPFYAILTDKYNEEDNNKKYSYLIETSKFNFWINDFKNTSVIEFDKWCAKITIKRDWEYSTDKKKSVKGIEVIEELINSYDQYNYKLANQLEHIRDNNDRYSN